MNQEVVAVPTYEYRCVSCEHQFERFQRMSDDPVSECEVCGQAVKRLLFPVAIHFKGSGFYSTDYSKKSSIGPGSSSTACAASGQASGDSGSETAGSSSAESAKTSADKPAEKSSGSATERTPVAVKSD
jgi:putative FmdB family regulatory protein